MRILSKYRVRQVANENIVLVQGSNPGDMTTVIALNETSLYLWNSLKDRDFENNDVVRLLMERYDVDEPQARTDAEKWIETLKERCILDC
ncbi:MAG: PqqD family protein [Bacteroidales bacterium]|nr:PqqD family protein [Bacteroidales bacterium]